jgi:KDO2-lipid IV(A) lauroyltransferase
MQNFIKSCRHQFEYIIFKTLTNLIRLYGIDKASNYCAKIATIIGPWLPITRTARRNLYLAFPNLNKRMQQKIIHDLWDNFGRFIGEFPHIHDLTPEDITKHIEIIGIENIATFQKNHQPFILCTGHFANWDLALRILESLYPKWGVMYRRANNNLVNDVINKWRSSDNINLIAKGPSGARSLVKSIKEKHSLCMLVDQKMNDGISIPFFNRPAMTAHAIAKLALQYDYPIIPTQIVRKNGCRLQVIIHPELRIDRTANEEIEIVRIMTKINERLEQWIRENPGQWFWFHNRWGKM